MGIILKSDSPWKINIKLQVYSPHSSNISYKVDYCPIHTIKPLFPPYIVNNIIFNKKLCKER